MELLLFVLVEFRVLVINKKYIFLRSKCEKSSCQEHTLVKLLTAMTAMALNPLVPYHLACAGLDGVLRLYDRRMLSVGTVDDGTFRSMAEQSVIKAFNSGSLLRILVMTNTFAFGMCY